MQKGVLPPLRPIPIKERLSVIFIERGEIDVLDGAFVVVDVTGIRLAQSPRANSRVPNLRGEELNRTPEAKPAASLCVPHMRGHELRRLVRDVSCLK